MGLRPSPFVPSTQFFAPGLLELCTSFSGLLAPSHWDSYFLATGLLPPRPLGLLALWDSSLLRKKLPRLYVPRVRDS